MGVLDKRCGESRWGGRSRSKQKKDVADGGATSLCCKESVYNKVEKTNLSLVYIVIELTIGENYCLPFEADCCTDIVEVFGFIKVVTVFPCVQ